MNLKQIITITALLIGTTICLAENRALLIGIDDYKYITPLEGSARDVELMKNFIKTEWNYQDAQIRTLLNKKATKQGILTTFKNWLIKGTQPGDNVLFYYSGHGTYIEDDQPGEEKDGYDEALCPVNAQIRLRMGKKVKVNLIRDDDIEKLLKQLEGRKVTLIIDACHSGTLTKSAFINPMVKVPFNWKVPNTNKIIREKPLVLTKSAFVQDKQDFINSKSNIVAYSAVSANQQALVDDTIRPSMGVFTRQFIDGIQNKKADSNGDNKITHNEIIQYTRDRSKQFCEKRGYCSSNGLTPQLEIKAAIIDDDIRIWSANLKANPISNEYSQNLNASPIYNEYSQNLNSSPISNEYSQNETPILEPKPQFAHLELNILPSNFLQSGQDMQIEINSDKSGFLLLFDTNTTSDTDLIRLYPNPYSSKKSVRIIADKRRIIPTNIYSGFRLKASQTSGERLLVALLVNNNNKLAILENALATTFSQITSKSDSAITKQLHHNLAKNADNTVQWTITTLKYKVK